MSLELNFMISLVCIYLWSIHCRRALFKEGSVVGHNPGQGQVSFKWHKQTQTTASSTETCTSHFIQPVAWMEHLLLGCKDGKVK